MCLLIHNYHVDPTYSYIHHTHIHIKTFLNLAWQDTHTHTDCLTAIILECVCTNQQVAWSSSFDDDDDNNHNWLFKSLKNMLTFRRFFFLCDLSTEIEFTWVIIIIIIIDCVLNLFWCLIFLFLHYVNHCFNLLLFFFYFFPYYKFRAIIWHTYTHTHTSEDLISKRENGREREKKNQKKKKTSPLNRKKDPPILRHFVQTQKIVRIAYPLRIYIGRNGWW